ncbi:MAG: preprotein translocase subunit SecE [Verrucomicrobiota bacterium]
MFKKLSNYFGEVSAELKKATWPWVPAGKGVKGFKRFKELTDSTIVVVIAMVLLGGFVALWDLVMYEVVEALIWAGGGKS